MAVQFAGARYSIIVGIIGILVPIGSALFFGGSVFYFYLLPIFGVVYGVRAITRGFVIGGAIGVALNVFAGLASLLASGVLGGG